MKILYRSAIVRFVCECADSDDIMELYVREEHRKTRVTCPNCNMEYELIFSMVYPEPAKAGCIYSA